MHGDQLLELPIAIGWGECHTMEVLNISATHCFLGARIAQLANLHLDISSRLNVCLVDKEQWACLGVACKVHVNFAPGIV